MKEQSQPTIEMVNEFMDFMKDKINELESKIDIYAKHNLQNEVSALVKELNGRKNDYYNFRKIFEINQS